MHVQYQCLAVPNIGYKFIRCVLFPFCFKLKFCGTYTVTSKLSLNSNQTFSYCRAVPKPYLLIIFFVKSCSKI